MNEKKRYELMCDKERVVYEGCAEGAQILFFNVIIKNLFIAIPLLILKE